MELDIAPAIQRAAAKRDVLAGLSRLPRAAWKDLLVEILVEQGTISDGSHAIQESLPLPVRPPLRSVAHAVESAGVKTTALVGLLAGSPGMAIGDLAFKLYGVRDATSMKKTRALLVGLKRQGRTRTVGRGHWEVVPTKP
jgi:hypothetical protein